MCTVSMIFDNFRKYDQDKWTIYPAPTTGVFPIEFKATRTPLDVFEELVKVAKELDTALGLADCEDPKKGEWLDEIRKIVENHEIQKVKDRLKK